jgi:predicted secreted protein
MENKTVGQPPGPDGAVDEQDRDAKTMTTTLGSSVHIHLWEDRTRGELWVPSYDHRSLVLVSDDFLRTASSNAVDAGQRTFEFKAVATGTHRLVFEKRMGWKFTAEDRRVFRILVGG